MASLFLLEPGVIFLNHGSFGACPRPVFESYQRWQRELERQPVRFMVRELNGHLLRARDSLADFMGADPNNLIFVRNATQGVNTVARSLPLEPGDEVLASDHEYGACDNVWNYVCRKTGAVYVQRSIELPVESEAAWFERFWEGVNERTKVIYLSHITSPTALRLPVEAVCRRARQAGILTLIDGAHAPGQIDLELEVLGADFYTGNCHKWLMAPKGAGFLHVRRERQALVEPLVVSWGWSGNSEFESDSPFWRLHQGVGTADLSAYLAVEDAVAFHEENGWPAVRIACRKILEDVLAGIEARMGLPRMRLTAGPLVLQMGASRLPHLRDLQAAKQRLWDEHRVEVPLIEWNGQHWIRVSIQGYNTRTDGEALLHALDTLLR